MPYISEVQYNWIIAICDMCDQHDITITEKDAHILDFLRDEGDFSVEDAFMRLYFPYYGA